MEGTLLAAIFEQSVSFWAMFALTPIVPKFALTPVKKAVAVPAESGTCLSTLYVCCPIVVLRSFKKKVKEN